MKYYLAFLLLVASSIAKSQVCTGALGDAIDGAGTNFGSGVNAKGDPLSTGITSYNYVSNSPDDGQYTIVKTTAGLNGGWLQNVTNHTPNNANGYMMVVNASRNQDTFFTSSVNNLCPNTVYEFSAYIINIIARAGSIRPNVKFTIENNGLEIKSFSTGDIAEGGANDWKKYGTIFTTPANVGNITLRMTNINPGGGGNDLALDDIEFRACGPLLATSIDGVRQNQTAICVGENKVFNLSVNPTDGYNNPVYQWQVLNGNTWENIANATTTNTIIPFTNAQVGRYQYRMLAAESGNISSSSCRVATDPFVIAVVSPPSPIISGVTSFCEGSAIRLSADGGFSYNWTGPNGFTSNQQNPTIPAANVAMSGTYTVNAANETGCIGSTSVYIKVLNAVVADGTTGMVSICEGGSVQLQASGGNSYQWSPSTGLSNPNITNPIATPTATTIYTATVSNETCSDQISITVNVRLSASADAGSDKSVLSGSGITLEGKISGDNVTYHWEPSDFLDDPTKLNPIAKPDRDITYKLVAQSDCNISEDEVTIKVIQEIKVPNTFTPNGDGINDTWTIKGLELIGNVKLKVFNRNGQTIYSYEAEQKPWDGKYQGKDVPVGTYYYTMALGAGYENRTGWLLITR